MKNDFEDKKKPNAPEFTKDELINCRRELARFKQISRTFTKPNGETYTKLISKLQQYMEILGVIRFSDTGECFVRDCPRYDRLTQLETKLDNWDWHRMQEHFEQHPEARKEHLAYISEIGNKVKGIGNKFKA